MLGIILNCSAIILASIVRPFIRTESIYRSLSLIRIVVILIGLIIGSKLTVEGILHSAHPLKITVLVILSLLFGKFIGHFLKLQQSLNRLGRYVSDILERQNSTFQNYVLSSWVLFGLNPLGIIGPTLVAINGKVDTLLLKSLIDISSLLTFPSRFAPACVIGVFPIFGWMISWYWLTTVYLSNFLTPDPRYLLQAICGVILVATSIQLSKLMRIYIADYWPSLLISSFFAWKCL